MTLAIAYEGDTDLPFIEKLAAAAGLDVHAKIDCSGKGYLDENIGSYNCAAAGSPWFVLRDLDNDAPCAPRLDVLAQLAPEQWMCFRIAVRELEAWLLADHMGVAEYFGISPKAIPADPDSEADPTLTLVNLTRGSSRRAIRKAMVPKPGMGVSVGPGYEAAIIEFGRQRWDLGRARVRSPSLQRAYVALRSLGQRWAAHVQGL
jgi:hypothetical protein